MDTRENDRQELIDAGMAFSKWMRTHDTIQIAYMDMYFGGKWKYLLWLTQLPGRPILEYVNSADLHYVQGSKKEQRNWTERQWAEAIDDRLEIAENMQNM